MVGLGQMPGQAGTDESLSAMAVIVGSLIEERYRITRSIRIGPVGETTAVSFPFPVAHSGIHLRFITAVVDIATGIPAAAGVDSGLQATVVTVLDHLYSVFYCSNLLCGLLSIRY